MSAYEHNLSAVRKPAHLAMQALQPPLGRAAAGEAEDLSQLQVGLLGPGARSQAEKSPPGFAQIVTAIFG